MNTCARIVHLIEQELGGPPHNKHSIVYKVWLMAKESLLPAPSDEAVVDPPSHSTSVMESTTVLRTAEDGAPPAAVECRGQRPASRAGKVRASQTKRERSVAALLEPPEI